MSQATVQGRVHLIEPTKTFGARGFRKRLVVLEQELGSFVNYIPIEFIKEGCDAVDELAVGDQITIRYRLSGRRWQRDPQSEVKFFLSAEGLDFQRDGQSAPSNDYSASIDYSSANAALDDAADEADLPF